MVGRFQHYTKTTFAHFPVALLYIPIRPQLPLPLPLPIRRSLMRLLTPSPCDCDPVPHQTLPAPSLSALLPLVARFRAGKRILFVSFAGA